jgi:hypothetical protein
MMRDKMEMQTTIEERAREWYINNFVGRGEDATEKALLLFAQTEVKLFAEQAIKECEKNCSWSSAKGIDELAAQYASTERMR